LYGEIWGHNDPVVANLKRKWDKLWENKGYKWFEDNVSKYAGTNAEEAFSESFSAYTSKLYGEEHVLPREIVDILGELLG
jgi:hypothetical protein